MLRVPLGGTTDSAIIAIVDRLTLGTSDVCLKTKVIEEDIEALVLILSQTDDAVVKWQGSILNLLQHCLKNDYISKCRFNLEEIHPSDESICVRNKIVAILEVLRSGWSF